MRSVLVIPVAAKAEAPLFFFLVAYTFLGGSGSYGWVSGTGQRHLKVDPAECDWYFAKKHPQQHRVGVETLQMVSHTPPVSSPESEWTVYLWGIAECSEAFSSCAAVSVMLLST